MHQVPTQQKETRLSQIWKLSFGLQSNKAVGFQCKKAIHTWKNKNCSLNSATQEGEGKVPAAILLKTKPTAHSPIKMCASTGEKYIYKYPTLFILIMKLFHLFGVLIVVVVFFNRRGKPLYICKERYKVLEQQWVSHTFDHINKRWGPHYNGL